MNMKITIKFQNFQGRKQKEALQKHFSYIIAYLSLKFHANVNFVGRLILFDNYYYYQLMCFY